MLGSTDRCRPVDHHDVHLETDQLRHELGEPVSLPFCKAVRHGDVPALDVPEVAQPMPEGLDAGREIRGRARNEQTEPGNVRRLLRLGSERRHEEAEGEGEHEPEGPEPHGGVLLKYTCVLTVGEQRCSPQR